MRRLIVNADDFGATPGINRGIARAHEEGIVTSASLMVRREAAGEAAAYARRRPQLGVGLHVDLGEWRLENGDWRTTYARVPLDDADAVAAEATSQLESFRRLLGRDPTHLDSHQHVHRREPARSVLRRLARELGVPLRHYSAVRYCGAFYGQDECARPLADAIEVEALLSLVAALPAGTTELCCHPGEPDGLEAAYGAERARELESLCDPRVRALVADEEIVLCTFREAQA
jgi:predicted glycoside hydrolase/deacetylase ChbG (UPF0249 family)